VTTLSNPHLNALQSVLGHTRVDLDPTSLSSYAIDNLIPSAVAKPASPEEAGEIIRFAAKEKLAVIPIGARTKLSMGATPARYEIALDMSALNQIAHYDPADLTVSVGAGMSVAKFNALLLERKQYLPLLVPYYSQSTIGGTIASGLDSPLRQHYGTARDFLLGAEFIDGTGSLVKSGGRVVKNVTGYDLHKLLIGSLGTLAVITNLNFRTFPMPLATRGFLASFPTHEAALAARRRIAQSPLTPLTLDAFNPRAAKLFATQTPSAPEVAVFAGEAHQPTEVSLPLPGEWFHPNEWQLSAGFAGNPEVPDRYDRDLTQIAEQSRATSVSILDDTTRPSIWGRLREALPIFLESSPSATILKLTTVPAHQVQAITVLESVAIAVNLPLAAIARASGALYIAMLPAGSLDSAADSLAVLTQEILSLSRSLDGRASLLFAPPTIKSRLESTLNSYPRPDLELMRRLKFAFDPQNIFAPDRLFPATRV
jgi:glycolate oxidase FAD binding subunit